MLLHHRNAFSGSIHTLMILLLVLLGIGLYLGGCDQALPERGRQLSALPLDKDVRLSYSLMPPGDWQNVDQLELSVDEMLVSFIETDLGCNDEAYLESLAGQAITVRRGGRPRSGEPEILQPVRFHGIPGRTLIIGPHELRPVLQLSELNHLPNGFISELRLKTTEMVVVRDGERIPFEVPHVLKTQGLILTAKDGPVPVCNGYITNINFVLESKDWLAERGEKPDLFAWIANNAGLTTHLIGTTTAPKAVYPDNKAKMEVPGDISITVPRGAVKEAMVIRVGEVEKPAYQSVDFIFSKLMQRVGKAYDIKPDGFVFQRPISIALPVPMELGISNESLGDLKNKPLPKEMMDCLREVKAQIVTDAEELLRRDIFDCVDKFSDKGLDERERKKLAIDINNLVEPISIHVPESMALFTWSPSYKLWLPDVPRLLEEHEQPVIDELDRVIAAEASNPGERIKADFSMIPAEVYEGLDLDRINNRLQGDHLITASNHFCIKSLFADLNLNVVNNQSFAYEPLLEGALDDMCQTTDGFGFVIDSNENVHCGGDPASEFQMNSAARKTKRAIREDGIALRFRNNVYSFFDDLYPSLHPGTLFPELIDLEDDVLWAVRVWQEAINRNPDGTWNDRFMINCTDLKNDAESICSGREIDIGIRDYDDTPGKSYARNFNLDEDLVNDAIDDPNGRLILRSVILHEMGHVLGLNHWAGAGALMSYNGRIRRNDYRYNLCAPFFSAANYPYEIAESEQYCLEPEMAGRYGTTYEPDPTSGDPVYHNARMNRLSCTDVQRIRQQINDAGIWTTTDPLRCEIMSGQTEYAAFERQEYDSAMNEAYYVLELDLRFKHCGDSEQQFTRMEFELLGVNADNDSDKVANLYKDDSNPPRKFYEIELDEPDANGFYTVPIRLESRNLLDAVTRNDPANPSVDIYPTFREYLQTNSYPSLAMVIRTYAQSTSGDHRNEFITGSTGLLRSPLLTPIDVPISFGLTSLSLDGQIIDDEHPLLLRYDDYVTANDMFPHIDKATRKPNIGKVLYVVVPPHGADDTDVFEASFTWSIPDEQYDSFPGSPSRIWIDSIEYRQEDVPTIDDWAAGGGSESVTAPGVTVEYQVEPGVPQDPTQHLTNKITLAGTVSDIPLRNATINGNTVEVWDLYHFMINYDYIPYNCPLPPPGSPPTPPPDVSDPANGCTPGSLSGNRTQDFYVSISGPTGAIFQPGGSRCLLETKDAPGDFGAATWTVSANVRSLKLLSEFFQDNDLEFQVRIIGTTDGARKGGQCISKSYGEGWVGLENIGEDGILEMTAEWENNCNDYRYTVELQYQHRSGTDEAWSEPITLDTETIRFDRRGECNDTVDYEKECRWEDGGAESCR